MKWRSAGGVGAIHRRTSREHIAGRIAARAGKLPVLWRWADRVPELLLPAVSPFARVDRLSAEGLSVQREPLVPEMAELVRALPWDGRIRHVRDETFLGWRYKNPLHEYRFIFAGGDRLEGYLVLQRLVRRGHRRICIADWEARDERVFEALLAAAIGGGFSHLHAWSAGAAPGGADVLARNGFEAAEEFETSILARATRDEEMKQPWMLADRRLDSAPDWDVRMIYSARG
jgi:hypothetical protein